MLSDTIKILRLSRGLTQQDVAGAIGVSQGTIYFWENNINKPSSIYLSKLANLFNVSILEVLDEEDEKSIVDEPDSHKRQSAYHELVQLYSKLRCTHQSIILALMRELARSSGKKNDNDTFDDYT